MSVDTYQVACWTCHAVFDAVASPFCECLVKERTLVCPHCGHCFCSAPHAYKLRLWSEAPEALWDRKLSDRKTYVATENPPPDAVKRPLVLIVEDEKAIEWAAVRAVEALGYGVVLARNGQEGLELAKRYKPDLVLSDAFMPKLDGREMCRLIKEDAGTANAKTVLMTSLYTAPRQRHEGLKEFRIDDYLSKPLSVKELQSVLAKHLG